jgi:hypothetical protein
MFESFLQENEVIESKWECNYCSDGAMAAILAGHAVLTNQRFFICKDKTPFITPGYYIGLALFAFFVIGRAAMGGGTPGALDGAIFGAVCFAIGVAIEKFVFKSKEKGKVGEIAISAQRNQIESVEDGNRGVAKMLVVKASNITFKVNTKDKSNTESLRNTLKALI